MINKICFMHTPAFPNCHSRNDFLFNRPEHDTPMREGGKMRDPLHRSNLFDR